jgi:hypothetical protein
MNTSYSIKTKIKYKWKAIGYQYLLFIETSFYLLPK